MASSQIFCGLIILKKVVAINGSPRKASTLKLLNEIAEQLETHLIQVTILNMGDYQVDDCIGCEVCIRNTSQCVLKDDTQKILSQILAADGVILASPVYVVNITGRLKSLIDKTCSWFHRPPMAGKPMLSVATTGGSGLKEVLKYLEDVAVQWGMQPSGRIGQSIATQKPVSEKEIRNFVWHLENSPRKYSPSLGQVMQYQVQRVLALKLSSIDHEYWNEHGWDKQIHYYPESVSLINRVIAWCLYQILYRRINPVNPF